MKKTKLIVGLTVLALVAMPLGAVAAQKAVQTTVRGAVSAFCPISGCTINGIHSHAGNHNNHRYTEHNGFGHH